MHPEVRHDLTGTDPTRWSGIRWGRCEERPGGFKGEQRENFEVLTFPAESDAKEIWTPVWEFLRGRCGKEKKKRGEEMGRGGSREER